VDARFALIGGLALASHKVIRATQDIDLLTDAEKAEDIDRESEEVVRVALAAYDAGRVVRVVGLTNRLLAVSGALTPRFIPRGLMAKMFAPTTAASDRPETHRT
jgi:hypothetical protein